MPSHNFKNFLNNIEKSLSIHLDFIKSYQPYTNDEPALLTPHEAIDTNEYCPDFIFLPLIDRRAFAETIKNVDYKLKTRKHPLVS
jgi:hypothetical protein